jgi:hypothetical protein
MMAAPRLTRACMAVLMLMVLGVGLPYASAATDADERALVALWRMQHATPHEHAALLDACQVFDKEHPSSAFGGVADTLAAWHLLKLGRTDEAVVLLAALPRQQQEGVDHGAYEVGAAWLSRIDRTRVQQALQFYYRREIGYPATLEELTAYPALPKSLAFPAVDRWGRRWDYRLVGFRRLSGMLNQKYALTSPKLGSESDFEQALAQPYKVQITARIIRVRTIASGRDVVEMEIESPAGPAGEGASARRRKVVVGLNSWSEGLFLAYVGRNFILVCDRSYWQLLPKPRTRG